MAALVEIGSGAAPDPAALLASRREVQLSRLLMAWISAGLLFMLLPGTFLGVWNLIAISSRKAADSISPAWLQAHGHAQVFGWIGSFILGIGFYSLPKLLRGQPFRLWRAWTCFGFWISGVGLRWISGVYGGYWRVLMPGSAVLELIAFGIFVSAVSGHRPQEGRKLENWTWIVIVGTGGFMLSLLANLGGCIYVALRGESPAFPPSFDQRYLALITWGFAVMFVWGFSARWLPVFLGLKPMRMAGVKAAVILNVAGVAAALAGGTLPATFLLLCGAVTALIALRLGEKPQRPPKTRGVHPSFPWFVRMAYAWLAIAAALGLWAATVKNGSGIWGASRHALTVGFLAMMVFGIGQRILPAFSGMRHLFSTKLMFVSMALLTLGCALRVSSEVLAYQELWPMAWSWLPVSAVTELAAVNVFALNLWISFARPAPPVVCA